MQLYIVFVIYLYFFYLFYTVDSASNNSSSDRWLFNEKTWSQFQRDRHVERIVNQRRRAIIFQKRTQPEKV